MVVSQAQIDGKMKLWEFGPSVVAELAGLSVISCSLIKLTL